MSTEPDADDVPADGGGTPMAVALWQLARRIRANAERGVLAGSGLALPDYVVLHLIHAQPDVRVMDVSRQVAMAKATLSNILTKLTRRGLINRRRPPADRRTVMLTCTPAGAVVVANLDVDILIADAACVGAEHDLVALCEVLRDRIAGLDAAG